MQEAFRECHAPAVRLLHAGHDHAGRRPAQGEPEPHRARRSGTGSRATCAGAPATTTSSRPCCTPRPGGATGEATAGTRMTAVDAAPRSARTARRKEDQRLITGRTRWTDNITLPGMLHLAMVRSPFAHARITAIDTERGPGRDRTSSPCSPARTSPTSRASCPTPGRSPPTRSPRRTRRSPSTGSPSPARSSPSWWPAAPREARDAAELVDVDYDELPAVLDLKEAAAGHGPRAPRPRHQQVGVLGASTPARPAPAATSTRRSPRRAPTASSSSASTASSG